MKLTPFFTALIGLMLGILLLYSCQQHNQAENKDYWLSVQDTISGKFAYYAPQSKQKMLGDYDMAFTDTFKNYAIVADKSDIILIDRKGQTRYKIFRYENGPDPAAEGLYRIVDGDGKIGFAEAASAQIVIEPRYECAYPFEGGRAKVADHCAHIKEGDYTLWESKTWYYVDKKGNNLKSEI